MLHKSKTNICRSTFMTCRLVMAACLILGVALSTLVSCHSLAAVQGQQDILSSNINSARSITDGLLNVMMPAASDSLVESTDIQLGSQRAPGPISARTIPGNINQLLAVPVELVQIVKLLLEGFLGDLLNIPKGKKLTIGDIKRLRDLFDKRIEIGEGASSVKQLEKPKGPVIKKEKKKQEEVVEVKKEESNLEQQQQQQQQQQEQQEQQ